MTRVKHLAGWTLVAVIGCTLIVAAVQAQNTEKAEPKHAIKDVMKQAHTPGEPGGKSLLQRVTAGDASNEDKVQLLDLYISLVENDPPRGEKEAFHIKAGAAALAAAKVVVGREGAPEALRAAVNCAACHREHRPPTQ
jgi:hypothetical protein